MVISHEDQLTFLIIPRSVLLRMRNVSGESCRGNQNTFYVLPFFSSIVPFMRMWKVIVCLTGHRWRYGASALHAGYI